MPYLIDSDWVIDHLAGVPEATAILERLALEGIAISIITYMEVFQGVERAANKAEAQAALKTFLGTAPLLPLSPGVAERCAILRATLKQQGRRVSSRALDLIIAATALEFDLTLVTRNVEDYADIPNLRLRRRDEDA